MALLPDPTTAASERSSVKNRLTGSRTRGSGINRHSIQQNEFKRGTGTGCRRRESRGGCRRSRGVQERSGGCRAKALQPCDKVISQAHAASKGRVEGRVEGGCRGSRVQGV